MIDRENLVALSVTATNEYESLIQNKQEDEFNKYRKIANKLCSGEVSFKDFANNKNKYPHSLQEIEKIMIKLDEKNILKDLNNKLLVDILNSDLNELDIVKLFTSKTNFIANGQNKFAELAINKIQVFIHFLSVQNISKPEKEMGINTLKEIDKNIKSYKKRYLSLAYKNFNEKTILADGSNYILNEGDILEACEELIKDYSLVCNKTVCDKAAQKALNSQYNIKYNVKK